LAIADFILSQLAIGIWKQLITKVGIAWITAFKKVSFPALDMGLSTTPLMRFQTISYKKLKVAVGDLPTEVGIPK
jgi:hypothetical protein